MVVFCSGDKNIYRFPIFINAIIKFIVVCSISGNIYINYNSFSFIKKINISKICNSISFKYIIFFIKLLILKYYYYYKNC